MEAKDLRVGNYYESTKFKTPVKCEISDLVEIYYRADGVEIDSDHILSVFLPIPLTEEWLIKFGFENWGNKNINQYESYKRFVLYNVIDGTSNFEVHNFKTIYGGLEEYHYIISCDEYDRIEWGPDLKYVHQLQNLYFALMGKDLELKTQTLE